MNATELREDLAAAHRIFAIEALNEGTWTHLSCKLAAEDRYLVTPGDTHFSMVQASSLLLYDRAGQLLCGNGKANHDAVPIHLPVYEARPDIGCILHFHSPHATALTLLKARAFDTRLSQTAAYFHGKISYLDSYAVPRNNADEGLQIARALGRKKVLFMKNHGVLVAASTLADAVVSAYQLERACQLQVLAMATGADMAEMDEKYVEFLAAEDCNGEPGYFAGMKRLLDLKQPDFRL
ncbi:class II aldolase/adducin family protein [Denitrobaculum tricleocarpae]|uniref:Class II aldolase/adducin N-terminal domain-containing protein n=1 Tax=Denitrobaculum tricleocarpae TaxID=2591009 RepID=A0A545SXP9_9PROT|nr:class II aldolase/adducin family protein [Denitrobaculum tricleocarpae]TQV69734.1 hypothetical protein FKG95_28780 [Denitrobaculum tricleocarpae]